LAAAGAPLGGQGPHPGRQPAQGAAGDRTGWTTSPAWSPAASRAGHARGTAASRHQAGDPTDAAKLALRSIGRRWLLLTQQITALDTQLDRLVAMAAPALVAVKGVGTETAAALPVAAGDNPQRLRSQAAFTHLSGVAPIPASCGKTTRHRLHRGGNREANWALYLIAVGRMAWHGPTRAYLQPPTKDGKSKAEIIRCLNATSLESSPASRYPAGHLTNHKSIRGPEAGRPDVSPGC
jgi:Transposase IS116/IS110/IS902 family